MSKGVPTDFYFPYTLPNLIGLPMIFYWNYTTTHEQINLKFIKCEAKIHRHLFKHHTFKYVITVSFYVYIFKSLTTSAIYHY